MRIIHSRLQHGVGQGSFHSATVEVNAEDGSIYRFDYVYDCGALLGRAASPHLLRGIDRMDAARRPGRGDRAVIDALVLSHFDRDHIIGAAELAKRFAVQRIYVPYLTPEVLAFVLASQLGELEPVYVRALHGLATGAGTLFDVPVTMVQAGGQESNQVAPQNPDGPAPRPNRDALPITPNRPSSLEAIDGQTRQPVGPVLRANSNVGLVARGQSGTAPWILRFWNRGIDDSLVDRLLDELAKCGFPVSALSDKQAVKKVVDWLDQAKNRQAALQAYGSAIAAQRPSWVAEASGKRLANFLSIGLYSGPSETRFHVVEYAVLDSSVLGSRAEGWYWRTKERIRFEIEKKGRVAWLGTGDAPLGEPTVWADFSSHYAAELNRVLTVQVPHHGAAPLRGPKFFNAKLIQTKGMNAVVSVGKSNLYGHPRAAVLTEILCEGGNLEIVTEENWLGFHEVIDLWIR